MKPKINPLKQLMTALLAGLLASGGYNTAFAAVGNSTSGSTVPKLATQKVNQGLPVTLREKGVKTFEVWGSATAQKVLDESAKFPTSGVVTSIEISSTPASGTQCWAVVFDTNTNATAAGLTEGAFGLAVVPPFYSTATYSSFREYTYPRQFNNGLWLYVSAAGCRATVTWAYKGGD